MLISHRYRFIYTKTSKTAGTSVESFFEEFCMPQGEWIESHSRDEYESPTGIIGYRGVKPPNGTKWRNHMPASEIKKLIGQDIWDNYFKFCVVRNPFEKCISAFCHLGKDHKINKEMMLVDSIKNGTMSMEQLRFLDYIQKKAPIDRDKYLINDEFCLNDVIRFETLNADIERISQHIGLPIKNKKIPTFKMGIRGKEHTIESLYTDESREAVEKRYAVDLHRFGYSFPESTA